MSLFDVGSDVYTINYYNSIGEGETARWILVFVILSLVLQIGLVVAVHHKHKRRLVIQLVETVTFTKPAFNKCRVLTNAKIEVHEMIPPVDEMMMFKVAEVFAESIPVTVLQMNKVLMSDKLDVIVLLALLSSAAFVSEAVTYMTYMKDINAESRRTGKLFYGFVPLSGIRLVLVKVSMYVLSFCQLMGNSITVALLVQKGGKTLAIIVLSCEMGVYLLWKVVRRDFRYWMPLPRGTSLLVSVITRVVVKVIADFTGICSSERVSEGRNDFCVFSNHQHDAGMMHLRHPYEMGGTYWFMNMAYTQVSMFVSSW